MTLHRPNPRLGDKAISQINLTPFVGVLLAMFAGVLTIGWSHAEAEGARLDQTICDLPPFGAHSGPGGVAVSLSADGSLSISGRRVEHANLIAELRREERHGDHQHVWVRADADVPYGAAFALYQEIESAGPGYTIGLINEELD